MKVHEHAIADLNKVIEITPNDSEAYVLRAKMYHIQNKTDLAIVDCNHAIQANPRNIEAYATKGHIYHKNKEFERALDEYNKVLQLDPSNMVVRANRCNARYIYVQRSKNRENFLEISALINDAEELLKKQKDYALVC